MPNHFHFIIILGNYGFDNGVSVIGNDDNCDVDKIHEFYLRYNKPPLSENDIKQYIKNNPLNWKDDKFYK